jgi:hypothetical protein
MQGGHLLLLILRQQGDSIGKAGPDILERDLVAEVFEGTVLRSRLEEQQDQVDRFFV